MRMMLFLLSSARQRGCCNRGETIGALSGRPSGYSSKVADTGPDWSATQNSYIKLIYT
jgi:hypothetical protein